MKAICKKERKAISRQQKGRKKQGDPIRNFKAGSSTVPRQNGAQSNYDPSYTITSTQKKQNMLQESPTEVLI